MTIDALKRSLAKDDADTLAAMRAAPPGATYVIHNMRARGYFEACAAEAGRDDLVFVSLAAFEREDRWRGAKWSIVVDHYANTVATPQQRECIAYVELFR